MGRIAGRSSFYMLLAAVMLLISSCATLSPNGVGRVKDYAFRSERLPDEFDGYRVAFISDIHYPSLFTEKRLRRLVSCLEKEAPDLLLLGGDYVTDNDSIDPLFAALASIKPCHGIYAVLGNHEHRNSELIALAMQRHGIGLLADTTVELCGSESSIYIAGVLDSFVCDSTMMRHVEALSKENFVILLAHTPDYAERSSTPADIVLSGHTHGGQVSLMGLYTPVKNTVYGTRFLRGRNVTTAGTTVITTNGVGSSRKKIRFCAPSEVVLLTLKRSVR